MGGLAVIEGGQMRNIVVLSDLHLGDGASALEWGSSREPDLGWFRRGLEELGVEMVDYLVLAGDVLDFSVASYEKAYSAGRGFFTALRKLDVVKEIIYIPGNHDKDVWDSVQKEVSVLMRLRKGKDPTEFAYEQAGIIDCSYGGDRKLNMPGVDYARGRRKKKQYGALFLEGLFPKGKHLPLSVVYPNLYVVLPRGGWGLVTHGHLFELAWVFITEVFRELLKWMSGDPPRGSLKWIEECNIPANSLICTGLGQGGPSSRLFRRIQEETTEGKVKELRKVLSAFFRWADERVEYGFALEIAQDIFFDIAQRIILGQIKKHKSSRGSRTFLKDKKELIRKFLDATRLTVGSLKAKAIGKQIKEYPDWVIFGHTHVPIFAEKAEVVEMGEGLEGNGRIRFLNTGSCLRGETAAMIAIDEKGNCSSWRMDFAGRERC